MRILALETSGRHGSIAAMTGEDEQVSLLRQIVLRGDQRTAQSLAPAIKELLDQIDWSPRSVELVAVTAGPGSFTGLRIGVTTAKAFAYAVGANVVGVNTLAALADEVRAIDAPSSTPLWTILDAQRQELFVAKFEGGGREGSEIDPETVILRESDWLERLQSGARVVGPPLRTLQSRLPDDVIVVDENLWQPMAAAVGRIGWCKFRAGTTDDVWNLVPHYFRASAAEEKLLRTTPSPSGRGPG
jgi:tRNA threonylcarbamoyladenosine biosynthesis protein TsaB